ncbi:MAG TPA: hypothetical protein VGQ42_06865 [Candidatus Dormibacteraeota bacterium]|jgi:hypothetical protein|nr:hypothetical protein [Candidatus Dormibacteraeota bacterium]
MAEPPRRRLPGGTLPPHLARAHAPGGNGHAPPPAPKRAPAPRPLRPAPREHPPDWTDVDAEDERRMVAERVAFRRVAEVDPGIEVRASGRPSPAVVIAVLAVAGLIVLAVVLYRMAPP